MTNNDGPIPVRVRMYLPGDVVDPEDLSPTDHFNMAMEWLQHSCSTAQVIADYLHESEDGEVDVKDAAMAVESVAMMIQEGSARMSSAYSHLRWEQVERSGYAHS